MQKNRSFRFVWFAVIVTLFAAVVAACSGQDKEGETTAGENKTGQSGQQNGESQAPLLITMAYNFDGKEFPQPGNEIEKRIEEYTNVELDIQALPSTVYNEKLPVMVASGDIPKVIAGSKAPYMLEAYLDDVFWEVGPYLQEYPRLADLNEIIYKNISVEGKIYGLPRVRPIARGTYIYRKDWLNHLGLEEPKTIDDFYNVLRAFTFDDPDKNGQQDTYGMAVRDIATEVKDLAIFYGAPNNWGIVDGKFVKDVMFDEFMESLKFMKRLYDEGLINRDFLAVDRPKWEGDFEFSKAGIIHNTSNTVTIFGARVKSHVEDSEVDFFSRLIGPKGDRIKGEAGANGFLAFPKASVKSEEEFKRILAFFEKMNDEEMATLFHWGVEGVHYKVENGKAVRLDQQKYDDEVAYPYRWTLGIVPPEKYAIPGDLTPLEQKIEKVMEENEQLAVHDPTLTLISETYNTIGDQLNTIINDAIAKFVMGEIDEEGWKREIERWRQEGGDQVAKEFEEKYEKISN